MNIGIDLDGPVFNQEKFQLKKGTKFFKKKYIEKYYEDYNIKLKKSDILVFDETTGKEYKTGKTIDLNMPHIKINPTGYGIDEMFNCSEEEQSEFWYKYMIPYALFAPFRKDAVEKIKQLHSDGDKIFFPTARAKANENSFIGKLQRSLVVMRLKLKRIPYEKITYCSYKAGEEIKDKVNACIDNDLDLIIEDKKGNAEAIEEQAKIKALLYATRNNADRKNKDMPRFVNWGELYSGIQKEKEEEKFKVLHREEKEKLTPEERASYYKAYRDYHKKYIYDKGTIHKREENLKKVIKYGSFVFDRFAKHTVINKDRIPKKDGNIFTINHKDMLDIPLIMRVVGRRPLSAMLKAEFLDTMAEGFLTDIGCTFVKRDDKSIREQARETAAKRVLSGTNLIVCPEGTRNKTDKPLLDFDYGAVSIAQNTGESITPCAIYKDGKQKIINFGHQIEVGINDSLEEKNKMLFNNTLELLEECKRKAEQLSNMQQKKGKVFLKK